MADYTEPPKIAESALPKVESMTDVTHLRTIGTTDSESIAKENVRFPATQITASVVGITATDVNGAFGDVLTQISDLDGAMVHKTGNESIEGIKTFSSSPVVPTPTTDYQAATKAYADSLVVGLLDYRGGFDASVNAYPSSGGSGTGGAILKGDMWVVSAGGTIDGKVIHAGDSLIANVDAPGQTTAKWNTVNSNLTYVPEDVANKKVDLTSESDIFYPSVGAVTRGMAAERTSIIESLTLQIDGGTAFSVYGGAGVIDGGASTTF